MTGKLLQGGQKVASIGSGDSASYTLPDNVGNIFNSSEVTLTNEVRALQTVHVSGSKEGEGFTVRIPRTLEVIKHFKPGNPPLQLDGGLLIQAE